MHRPSIFGHAGDLRQSARLIVWCLAVCVCVSPAVASCELESGERGRVASIIDGDTVALEDGREVRLVGLQAPKLALGRRHFDDWPLAEDARAYLADLTLNETVSLSYGGRREDRYGRLLAHLHLEGGQWVQGAMVAGGLARVYSFPDNRSCVGELLHLEQQSRDSKQLIWNHSYYAVLAADEPHKLLTHIDSFQLVEGRVVSVALVRGRLYLNFGDDWREDFTVTIAPKHLRQFSDDLEIYRNARLRVRGWIKSYNGPEIVATHPEQIEFLDGTGHAS